MVRGWGLTGGGRQQAQVVETLVAVQLPLLKQEVHHLGEGALWLGRQARGQGTGCVRGRQAAGGRERGEAGGAPGGAHLTGQQQQQEEVAAVWSGGGHASERPPPTSGWDDTAEAKGSSWARTRLRGCAGAAAGPAEGPAPGEESQLGSAGQIGRLSRFSEAAPLSLRSYWRGGGWEGEDARRSRSLPTTGSGSGPVPGVAAPGCGGCAVSPGGSWVSHGWWLRLAALTAPEPRRPPPPRPCRWWPPSCPAAKQLGAAPLAPPSLRLSPYSPPILSPWERRLARLGRGARAIHHGAVVIKMAPASSRPRLGSRGAGHIPRMVPSHTCPLPGTGGPGVPSRPHPRIRPGFPGPVGHIVQVAGGTCLWGD